ncbi:MAG: hypothetical protein UX68_C0041G0004 [Parcubacteria group bacterium GW2011_GWA2_46_9]|uniref:Uncharacterized protein n=1 Tax=Candidatus Buchananbacteria bacterium RIFCSPHIGHO2_02_FULL_56_16 TaxID=1797542 RepID=A0A1G1YFX2_9BACT|nr:MAG: hypothetical protein UX68_C0041G0004 [Parcubacteria group bacterium GW2011_GWA2_46_9]OGY51232.1 MAG: hypothetical protein A3J59_02630 [Candidatus Buchananbacteria bacterium RIFCSPHIGHO2_02_FULL_56_16]
MFWKFREVENGKDEYGRTYEEARREHALWCLKTFLDNAENDQLAEEYLHKNCASWISRSDEDAKFFKSDAALNAFYETKTEFKEFKQYYPEETILHFKKNGWD